MRGGVRLITVAGALVALAVAGCGKKEKESLPDKGVGLQPRGLKIVSEGTAKSISVTLPSESVRAGLTRIDFTNDAKGKHALQFVRVDGQHRDTATVEAANAWGEKGKPLPAWIHPEGGTAAVPSSGKSSTTQMLPPGHYIIIDTEGGGSDKPNATLEATGDSEGAVPGAPARISTFEYGFKPVGLTHAAAAKVLIQNTGTQPHFVAAAPLKPGKTLADVRSFLKSHKGPDPTAGEGVSTPVIDRNQRIQITLDLKPGRYALLCFVPDRKGGPPHAFKGMVGLAQVR